MIDSMFVYHFVDSDLRVDAFHANEKKFMQFQENVYFLIVVFLFDTKKIAFKSSLDLYFHPSISEFRMEEKIHTKALVNVSRSTGGRIFQGEIREGVSRNLLSPVKRYQEI